MRGIVWALTNDLQGDYFVSNWAKNKKGKIENECKVVIDSVSRVKGKDYNGYVTEGSSYEALRGTVPDDISRKFRIGKVNIQRQLDGPFMLSNTSGENAKYINELVNLSDIDKASTWVGSQMKDCTSRLKHYSECLESLERSLVDESRMELLGSEIEELKSLSSKIDSCTETIERMNGSVCEYKGVKRYDTGYAEGLLLSMAERLAELEKQSSVLSQVQGTVSEYRELSKKSVPQIDERRIERTRILLEELSGSYSRTEPSVREFKSCEEGRKNLQLEIKDLEATLSTMACPMCGRIGKLDCHNNMQR